MKKVVYVFLSTVLSLTSLVKFPSHVLAKDNEIEISNNYTKKVIKVTEFYEETIIDELGNQYRLVSNDQLSVLYNQEGVIVGRIYTTVTEYNSCFSNLDFGILPMALIDDYDKWNGWYDAQTTQLQIDVDWSLSRTALVEAIKIIFTKKMPKLTEVLLDYAVNRIIDMRLSIATVSLQYNQNKYCSILRKERSAVGNGYSSEIIDWTGNPWDFTGSVESACRTLTERYW